MRTPAPGQLGAGWASPQSLAPRRASTFWVLIITLAVTSFGLSFSLADLNIRPERIFAVLMLPALPIVMLTMRDRMPITVEALLLAVWLMLALISSALSELPEQSVKQWANMSLAAAYFFLAVAVPLHRVVATPSPVIPWLGCILGGGGALLYLLFGAGIITPDSLLGSMVSLEQDYYRIRMLSFEPNLYGSVMMILALLSLARLRSGGWKAWLVMIATHAGLMASLSRGPLLGYVFGALLLFLLLKSGRRFAVLITCLLGATLMLAALSSLYGMGRDLDLSHFDRIDTIQVRMLFAELAWEDILAAPWLGNGVYSFSFLHLDAPAMVGSHDAEGTGWLGTMPLAILHDTGVIGFVVLSVLLFRIAGRAFLAVTYRLSALPNDPVARSAAHWLAAWAALCASSLSTTTHALAIFWLMTGIVHCLPRLLVGAAPPPRTA
jgi:hypothetical protein